MDDYVKDNDFWKKEVTGIELRVGSRGELFQSVLGLEALSGMRVSEAAKRQRQLPVRNR